MTSDELVARILGEGAIFVRLSRFAKLADIGKTKAFEMAAKGDLKIVEIGGMRRVPITEVLRFLNLAAEQPAGTGE